MTRHSIDAQEAVELIHEHGLFRLEIEANGKVFGVAVVAETTAEVMDTLTRQYGEWKLIRDKQVPA